MPPPLLSSSTASSDANNDHDKAPPVESANSSNDLLASVQTLNRPKQLATPLPQSVTPAYDEEDEPPARHAESSHAESRAETQPEQHEESQSVLDQHEDDITQFLHNYSVNSRIIDQFDVAQALMQNQVARVNTPPPPPPPPPETYEALLDGLPPGRKSPSLPIQETTNRMLFGKNDKALSHRRRMFATSSAFTDYEADLSSSDRVKAKTSVMRFLKDKIRTDWKYAWPKPDGENADTEYEFDEANAADWREREDWESGVSEDDEENRLEELASPAEEKDLQADAGKGSETAIKSITTGSPPKSPITDTIPQTPIIDGIAKDASPFRFETPEKVGEIVQKKIEDKKERRRQRRLEMQSWNEGLDCWTRRRDAWTCARKILPPSTSHDTRFNTTPSISLNDDPPTPNPASPSEKGKSKQATPPSTLHSPSPSPLNTTRTPITQIPIAHPLIPPSNTIRSQIGPQVYSKIYEKVVTSSITPAVPINLKDITRSCVEGWKREGEWPPRQSVPEPSIAHAKKEKGGSIGKLKSLGLLGKAKRDSGNGGGGALAGVLGGGGAGGNVGGGGADSRRSSLASVFGLDKVKSILGRRGSGSVGGGGGGPGSKDGDGGGGAGLASPGLPPADGA